MIGILPGYTDVKQLKLKALKRAEKMFKKLGVEPNHYLNLDQFTKGCLTDSDIIDVLKCNEMLI